MSGLSKAADRWRWFWHKPDIIYAVAVRTISGDRRALSEYETSMARAMARRHFQDHSRMSPAGKTAGRKYYMYWDREQRNELRNKHKRARTSR